MRENREFTVDVRTLTTKALQAYILVQMILWLSSFCLAQNTGNEKDYQIKVPVNLVLVPVSVEDPRGNLVVGLEKENFEIAEDGVPQKISTFSCDPAPLSAVLLVDRSIDEHTQSLLKKEFGAILESFSGFDEIALYEFLITPQKIEDFTFNKDALRKDLQHIPFLEDVKFKSKITRPTPHLDSAIGVAARQLAKRPNYFRKLIVVFTSGNIDLLDRNSYWGGHKEISDTKEILLNHDILVYGLTSPFQPNVE